jgi:hypothetical protein
MSRLARICPGAANERGAVLIQVAVATLALLALSAFVWDFGMMWASRREVQNAADAGAHAGAVALAFDYGTDAQVQEKARAVALQNRVWAGPPDVQLADVHIEPCPPTPGLPPDTCVRVEAFRNQPRGNPLPVFFASLVNVANQGVRATATARGVAANAARCLRPWAVADKWLESTGPWTQQATYQPPADVYTPPTAGNAGTGFSNQDANGYPVDRGLQLTLKLAHSGPPGTAGTLTSGWSMAVDLPNAANPNYANNISGCTTATVAIAPPGEQCLTADASRGCLDVFTGAQTGPVANPNGALSDLINTDASASWSNGRIINSNSLVSPRIVPVAVFDPALYLTRGYNGTNGIVKITNIVGFFVEGRCSSTFYHEPYLDCSNNGNDIVGRLVEYSGVYVATGGTTVNAFGTVITLVR